MLSQYAEIPHGIEMLCFPDAEYLCPNKSVEDRIIFLQKGEPTFWSWQIPMDVEGLDIVDELFQGEKKFLCL